MFRVSSLISSRMWFDNVMFCSACVLRCVVSRLRDCASPFSLDKDQPFKSSWPNTNTLATAHHLSKLVKAAARQNAAAQPEQQQQFDVAMVRELGETKLRRFHQNLGKNRRV